MGSRLRVLPALVCLLLARGPELGAAEACRNPGTDPSTVEALARNAGEVARQCDTTAVDSLKKSVDPRSTAGLLAIQDEYRRYVERATLNGETVLSLQDYARRKAGEAASTAATAAASAPPTPPSRTGFEEIRRASAEEMGRCMNERRDPDLCRKRANALVERMKAQAGGNYAIAKGASKDRAKPAKANSEKK